MSFSDAPSSDLIPINCCRFISPNCSFNAASKFCLKDKGKELRNKSKEVLEIIPAIKSLKRYGLNIKGPLVPDTIFIKDYRNFDVIVGMYHDQVLPTFKSIFKFDAINLTLGLKYLRVSPDHGTNNQMLGKNKSNPASLISAIRFLTS